MPAAAVAVLGGRGRDQSARPPAPTRPAAPQRRAAARRRAERPSSTACPAPSCRRSDLGLPDLPGSAARAAARELARPRCVSRHAHAAGLVRRPGPGRGSPLLGTLGETDVIRNGTDVWAVVQQGQDAPPTARRAARHRRQPTAGTAAPAPAGRPDPAAGGRRGARGASTRPPRSRTDGTAGGRRPGRLRAGAQPRTPASLVGSVRIASTRASTSRCGCRSLAEARRTRRSRSASPSRLRPAGRVGSSRSTRRPARRSPSAADRAPRHGAEQPRPVHRTARRRGRARRSSAPAGPRWSWRRCSPRPQQRAGGRRAGRRPLRMLKALPTVSRHLGQRARCSAARCSRRCSPTTAGSPSAPSRPERLCTAAADPAAEADAT